MRQISEVWMSEWWIYFISNLHSEIKLESEVLMEQRRRHWLKEDLLLHFCLRDHCTLTCLSTFASFYDVDSYAYDNLQVLLLTLDPLSCIPILMTLELTWHSRSKLSFLTLVVILVSWRQDPDRIHACLDVLLHISNLESPLLWSLSWCNIIMCFPNRVNGQQCYLDIMKLSIM